jgi:putative Holliday junction resolvase
MRYLGVDFGERHIGLALADDDGRLAVPVDVVTRASDAQAVAAVLEVAGREDVRAIVVGEPLRLDGSAGDAAERARAFAAKLGAATALEIVLHDEALTSHEAASRLREAGAKRRRRGTGRRGKGRPHDAIHSVAAQILLQDWLDRRRD